MNPDFKIIADHFFPNSHISVADDGRLSIDHKIRGETYNVSFAADDLALLLEGLQVADIIFSEKAYGKASPNNITDLNNLDQHCAKQLNVSMMLEQWWEVLTGPKIEMLEAMGIEFEKNL